MADFASVNANGAYYFEQLANSRLNPFGVLGLHAEDTTLTIRGLRVYFRTQVIPHVFKRGIAGARTVGPRVPT